MATMTEFDEEQFDHAYPVGKENKLVRDSDLRLPRPRSGRRRERDQEFPQEER
jgi:hypothetical protein